MSSDSQKLHRFLDNEMYELEFTLWERYRNIVLTHKRDIQYLAEFILKQVF